MFKRFILVTLFVGIVASFVSPFCVMYLIWTGYPEPAVDYYYWGLVCVFWLILELVVYLEWRINKDE